MPQTITNDLDYFFSAADESAVRLTSEYKSDFLSRSTICNISLFTNLIESAQDIEFNTLLNHLTHSIFFKRKIQDNSVIWKCFIDQGELHAFLQNIVQYTSFDYLIWPKNYQSSPKLIVFDMDSTFIQIEVIDELAKAHNVGDKVSQVTEAAMRGELDFSESLITRVACLQGLSSRSIDHIANSLPLSFGVNRLVDWAHQQGIKIAIVSGGFTPFVEKLSLQMNLHKVKANHLQIIDEHLTGKVLGDIVDAQAKADFVNELKKELNLKKNEIMSIGDGANDLLMMKETGFSLAYRAKPAVDKEAGGRMKSTHLDKLISVFSG